MRALALAVALLAVALLTVGAVALGPIALRTVARLPRSTPGRRGRRRGEFAHDAMLRESGIHQPARGLL